MDDVIRYKFNNSIPVLYLQQLDSKCWRLLENKNYRYFVLNQLKDLLSLYSLNIGARGTYILQKLHSLFILCVLLQSHILNIHELCCWLNGLERPRSQHHKVQIGS